MHPFIDKKLCNNCGQCLLICPNNVFCEINGEIVVKNPKNCLECRACEMNCKEKAITLKEEVKKQ